MDCVPLAKYNGIPRGTLRIATVALGLGLLGSVAGCRRVQSVQPETPQQTNQTIPTPTVTVQPATPAVDGGNSNRVTVGGTNPTPSVNNSGNNSTVQITTDAGVTPNPNNNPNPNSVATAGGPTAAPFPGAPVLLRR